MRIHLGGQAVTIDPDRLTPHARALAEAIAEHPARAAVDIWMEADQPIRETVPDWEHWYTAAEADKPLRRPWRGWSTAPLDAQDPHDRLEYEATKIPPGWHVLGGHPRKPQQPPVREVPTAQVLAYLRDHGRHITGATWRAYVHREQAPAPVRHVGRTPLWNLDAVDEWLSTRPQPTDGEQ